MTIKRAAVPSKSAKATAPKRSSTKAAIKKPVAASKTVSAAKSEAAKSDEANIELSKRELLERIVTESGMKKGQARAALDAVLTGLRSAIADGHDISAAPLGKIRVVRKKETPNGELAVLRVKLKDPKKMAQNAAQNAAKNAAAKTAAE